MATKNFQSQRYWEIKVQQWLSSGKSVKVWCEENQVIYTTFLGWRNRLKCNDSDKINSLKQNSLHSSSVGAHFTELKDKPKVCSGITLECEGVQIHLLAEFDPAILRKCLNVLRGVSC